MGSSLTSGNAAKTARLIQATKCKESKDGKHEWKVKGSWPSTWGECVHCHITYFDK